MSNDSVHGNLGNDRNSQIGGGGQERHAAGARTWEEQMQDVMTMLTSMGT